MKQISYIIGFRSSDTEDRRLTNLMITLSWLIHIKYILLFEKRICLNIIIIEQDSISKFIVPDNIKKDIKYLFVHNSGYYNRGWAFNVGYKSYISDYYFFADGDIIMNTNDMINMFYSCFNYEAVNPYLHIYDSTKEYIISDKLNPLIWSDPTIFTERKDTCFSGGIVGMKDSAYKIISGWDEDFRGRGWEDYAFTAKIKLFLYSIKTYKYSALHLWHPWEINTTREINEKKNKEYEQYSFNDYVNNIQLNHSIGSSIKYSISVACNNKSQSKYYLSDARYYYGNRIYKYAWKKYSNKKLVYLYLCDQLNNCIMNESGCNK